MKRLVFALALLAVAAPLASAATVNVANTTHYEPGTGNEKQPDDWRAYISTLDVAAAPGETNRIAMTLHENRIVLRDEGAPLSPGAGCEAIDANAVRCETGYPAAPELRTSLTIVFKVALGDGDDAFTATGSGLYQGTVAGEVGADTISLAGAEARGGEGDDTLSVSDVGTLDGGPGNDVLTGGAHGQLLRGGEGADRIDGGADQDTLSYEDHTTAVEVDLGAGTAGAGAAGDTFTAIEGVLGGAGDDVLRGDAGNNLLNGLAGADRLEGGAGADALRAGEGGDVLAGGEGDDSLDDGAGDDAADGGPGRDSFWGGQEQEAPAFGADLLAGGEGDDRFENLSGGDRAEGGDGDDRLVLLPALRTNLSVCGAGRDRIGPLTRRMRVPADCEQVDLGSWWDHRDAVIRPAALRRTRDAVSLPVPFFCDYHPRCETTLSVYAGGRLVARGRRVLRDGPVRRIRAPAVRGRARQLRRATVLEIRITARAGRTRYLDDGFLMTPRRYTG